MRYPTKPFLILHFAFLIVFSLLTCSYADYADGDGSAEFPFEIAEPNQLIYMSQHPEHWSQHFILTADINLALTDPNTFTTALIAPDTDNSTSGFQGTLFTGVFDGNSHTISNLTIDTAGAGNDYLGLLGSIEGSSAEVKNLGLENVSITGGDSSYFLGGLCGLNSSGSIRDCYANGLVTGGVDLRITGGLCGRNFGSISNCHATGSVIGGNDSLYLGGLCGINSGGGSIGDCYSSGSVTGGDDSNYLGGLCGWNQDGNINNCYSTGSVIGEITSFALGGFCGFNSEDISNCYFLDTAGPHNGEGTPLTDSEMKQRVSYFGFDFARIWWIDEGLDYPHLRLDQEPTYPGSGTREDPYQISTDIHLNELSRWPLHWDKHFVLTADIDMADYPYIDAVIAPDLDIDNDSFWFEGIPFTGSFDGCDHTISNLSIDTAGMPSDYLGLFGMIGDYIDDPNVEIKNLGLENVQVTGGESDNYYGGGDKSQYLGGLCGDNHSSGSISNCYVTGLVTSGIGSSYLGGLCGSNSSSCDFTNCYATVTITGGNSSGYFGSLCGQNLSTGSITNCFTDGLITGGDDTHYLAGMCGYNESGSIIDCNSISSVYSGYNSSNLGGVCGYNKSGSISNCDFSGSVTGFGYLGGLCGYNGTGSIINCDSSGSINGHGTLNGSCGGLCGYNDVSGTIINCSASGSITGIRYLGGVCGYNNHGSISNSNYSTGTITGKEYLGGVCGNNNFGSINNCYSTGSVNGGNGSKRLGGLCGASRGGSISFSYATGSVTCGDNSYHLGGLCGYSEDECIINNCYATGSVTGGYNSDDLGGLCGFNDDDISNCYSIGSVSSGDYSDYLGGLCGASTGHINNCYAIGSVVSGNNAKNLGGLCGINYNSRSSISNCYATGSVTGGDNSINIGGLVGVSQDSSGDISNCYSSGTVSGGVASDYLGGLCGRIYSGNIINCYFLETAGLNNGLGTPLTDSEMKQQSSFIDWDFNPGDGDPEDWFMSLMNYPRLSWEQTITFFGQPETSLAKGDSGSIQLEIYSRIDQSLNWTITGYESCSWITSLSPDSGVSTGPTDLTAITIDIDTATLTYGSYLCELILAADNGDNVIISIFLHIPLGGSGIQADPYRIEDFDGFMDYIDPDFVEIYWASGVYTRLDCDLDLDPNLAGRHIYTTAVIAPDTDNSANDFQGTPFAGIFDGNGHTISNLTIDTGTAGNDILGLFGQINDSYAKVANLALENVNITAGDDSNYLGGLCGFIKSGIISHCYSSGSVAGGNGSQRIGGLCGWNYSSNSSISYSYSSATVSGGTSSENLGGLCGYNYGNLNNSYATGSVTGGNDSTNLGGLCGFNYYSTIKNCYSTGTVTGDRYLGGLCGDSSSGSINNCYFLDTAGPDNGRGIPLIDSEMKQQSSFIGWDFVGDSNGTEDHWQMCVDGYDYPRLRWEFGWPGDFLRPGRVDQYDLMVLAHDWLSVDSRCGDIGPEGGDGIVNLFDYIEFSRYWLME
jgi:GLUG motif-containing protein